MATVSYPNGTKPDKAVKNLGWLIKHAAQVDKIVVTLDSRDSHKLFPGAFFFAHLRDGATFTTRFECRDVCRDWLSRSRALRGTPVEFCGETFLAGSSKLKP